MPWPKIVDRSPVEILLDDRRADVRRARYGRRVSEPLADRPHHRRDRALLLGHRLGFSPLRELDRGHQRPAPGAEVLGSELLAEVIVDVLVQAPRAEVDELTVMLVAEEAAPAGHGEQLLDRARELGVDEHRPAEHSVLRAEAEGDLAATD